MKHARLVVDAGRDYGRFPPPPRSCNGWRVTATTRVRPAASLRPPCRRTRLPCAAGPSPGGLASTSSTNDLAPLLWAAGMISRHHWATPSLLPVLTAKILCCCGLKFVIGYPTSFSPDRARTLLKVRPARGLFLGPCRDFHVCACSSVPVFIGLVAAGARWS